MENQPVDYEELREQLNSIFKILQNKPDKMRIGFNHADVGSILNAYRECDVSFEQATDLLKAKEKATMNKVCRLLEFQLKWIITQTKSHPDIPNVVKEKICFCYENTIRWLHEAEHQASLPDWFFNPPEDEEYQKERVKE